MFIPIKGGTEQETKNLKISLRSQLYSFFAAIRNEAVGVVGRGNWAIGHVRFAEQTAVRIEEGGLRLISKNQTATAEILRQALDLGREEMGMESLEMALEREAQESAERLRQKYGYADETSKVAGEENS